jgi:stress-induced morphogen
MTIETQLRGKLEHAFAPIHLELRNESPDHGLPREAEKHFRAVIVSTRFAGLERVERHRLVHTAVAEELRTHVHAFAVQALTPEEWAAKGGETLSSPPCLGGGKRKS